MIGASDNQCERFFNFISFTRWNDSKWSQVRNVNSNAIIVTLTLTLSPFRPQWWIEQFTVYKYHVVHSVGSLEGYHCFPKKTTTTTWSFLLHWFSSVRLRSPRNKVGATFYLFLLFLFLHICYKKDYTKCRKKYLQLLFFNYNAIIDFELLNIFFVNYM